MRQGFFNMVRVLVIGSILLAQGEVMAGKKIATNSSLSDADLGASSVYIGEAADSKAGAVLVLKGGTLRIEGQAHWPKNKVGRTLLVKGVLAKKQGEYVLEGAREVDPK